MIEDMEDNYEISEQDIESALHWLKINDPENANREKAIALLEDLQTGFHQMSHNNPDRLLQLQEELKRNKGSES